MNNQKRIDEIKEQLQQTDNENGQAIDYMYDFMYKVIPEEHHDLVHKKTSAWVQKRLKLRRELRKLTGENND